MFLRAVLIVLTLCTISQIWAQNSSSMAASPTVTIEVSSSVFSANQQAASSSLSPTSSQNTASSSSSTTDLNSLLKAIKDAADKLNSQKTTTVQGNECDSIDWYSKTKCTNEATCKAYLDTYAKQMKCIESKPENVTTQELAENLDTAGMKIAEDLMEKVKNGAVNNVTSNFFKDNFVMISGVSDYKYINFTKDEFLAIPNYSDPTFLTGKWETMRDTIEIPITELRKKGLSYWPYVMTVQSGVVPDRPLTMTEIETDYNEIIRESDVSDLYLDGNELKSRKKPQSIVINSYVFSFSFKSPMKDLTSPILITLRHKKDNLESPACVFYDKVHSIWSKKGCGVKESNSTHTICACNHLSMFAVAMKEKNVEDLSSRETLVTVAIVFGTISFILLLLAAGCIVFVGYYSVDNMKIALNLDMSLVLCHLFFFIGLSSEGSKFLATPATCEVIAPFVHMFELAALSFLLMEGLFYLDCYKKVFSKVNTRKFYIYASLGWGVPVAFGAAVAGYTYKHHGSPFRNEFCWMSVYGGDAWYFGTPVLVLLLLNLGVRFAVLHQVMKWKGNPDDINIERTKMRLVSAFVLLPIIIFTWLFGVLATNYSEDKAFHYFFVIFHALQGILVFVFYCARNKEMWDYYIEKKKKISEEKNAVYHFEYVP